MRNITSAGVVVVALLAGSPATHGQEVQIIETRPGATDMGPIQLPPPGRQLKTGTGRIKGRLIAADTATPVRRAQVRISGPEIVPKTAVTDTEGRYEFLDLPAGRFTISATKAGFVTMNYGQTRPFESGKPIELGEAQTIDKADFTMPRGSVISGRIVDEFGDPIADAQVSALRSSWTNGRRRLQPTGRTAQTNDLGQYRIYGLPPGDYYVSATYQGSADMMVMERVAATFVVASSGRGSGPGPSASAPRSGYAPTYYPGTANGSDAQKITVAVGQEMGSADFSLLPVRLARVSGMVIGSDGRPVEGAMVNVTPRNSDSGTMFLPMAGSGRTDRNGNFTLSNIAPGDYTLHVRGLQITTTSEGGNRMVFSTRISGGGDGQTEFGSAPLSVAGDDVSNVVVVTSKGTSASGRVVFEGGAKPSNTAVIRIGAMSVDTDGPALSSGSASVTAEDTFEIKGLVGKRLFRPMALPAGWILKSVTLNGTDITDTGVEVRPNEPISGLEVVLTTRSTEISGSVTADNRPATDYTLVVFPQDESKWTVPMTRYIAGVRPNQDGRFVVKNLPPGSYYAIAVEYVPQGDWNDPEVLDRLKSRATKFSLDEGEVRTLDLKLAGS